MGVQYYMKQHLKLSEKDFKVKDNNIFWNTRKCDSYDCNFSASIGGRGIGKTIGVLNKAMHRFMKAGEQFVYIRRYKSEIKAIRQKNPLDIIIDGVNSKSDGSGGLIFDWNGETCGYALPLTMGKGNKSANYELVTTIIFDEFTVKRGDNNYRYLTGETDTFWELIGSIVRLRTNYRIYLLGNNTDLFNPYYSLYNIPLFEDCYYLKDRKMFFEYPKNNPQLVEIEKKTPLYHMLKGTTYGDYYYDNKLITSKHYNYGEKPNNARAFIKLIVNTDRLKVYLGEIEGETNVFIERDKKCSEDNTTYILMKDGNLNRYYSKMFKERFYRFFGKYYYNNKIIYKDEMCGSIFSWIMEVLK